MAEARQGPHDTDLRELKELLELIPGASLGMWTNGQEEFLLQVERTRFEVRSKPLGIWPAPGEHTADLDRTGGVIQVSAEAEDLEDALLRSHRFLNRNLGLDHKDTFKQLAVLMLAKIFDETLPSGERKFWIKGDEPFTEPGQHAIAQRINESSRSRSACSLSSAVSLTRSLPVPRQAISAGLKFGQRQVPSGTSRQWLWKVFVMASSENEKPASRAGHCGLMTGDAARLRTAAEDLELDGDPFCVNR